MRRAAKRKVSYVITHNKDDHGHLLGINSLALDTTTLNSSGNPRGILYSAGRDGVINSWDLHLPLRKQTMPRYNNLNGINKVEEDKSKEKVNDDDNVPLQKFDDENNWEIDEVALSSQPTPKSTFRQSFQSHTDWVNDIILCHNNETLISCSSDRTMKLWHPHKTSAPYTIGYHTDYIKALAYASGPGWVASGGFDRKIALWDVKECRPLSSSGSSVSNLLGLSGKDFQPIATIAETSPKSSIYALACNSSGSVLVSGSPEKVIKVWDPKSGKRITKLLGHTDNIRALLISDDGELILSGSSDTTIKLWSLSSQRCINTFTIHSDSVWSLYSDHPRLEVFYSGSKDGLITRTDYSGCEEISDGECVAICKEDAGIVKFVTFDNKYIWTATYDSSIKRWQDIPMRKNRRKISVSSSVGVSDLPPSQNSSQIPSSSLIKLTSAVTSSPTHTISLSPPITAPDSEVATIYSVPIDDHYIDTDYEDPIPVREKADHIIEGQHGLIKYVMLNNRRNILTLDNSGEVTLWDIIKCVRVKVFGKCNIDEIAQEVNTPESIPNWCSVDTRIGALTVHLDESKCFDAEMYADEAGLPDDIEVRDDQRINLGKWVLRYLFENFTQAEIQTYEEIQQQRQFMQQQRQGNSLFTTQINVNIPPQAATSTTCTSPTTTNPNPISGNINPLIPQSPTTPLAAFTTGPFTAPATTNSQQSDYFSGSHHLNSPTTSPTTPPSNPSNKIPEGENTNNNGNNTDASTSTNSSVVTTTIQPPPPAFVSQNTNNSASISFMNKFKHTFRAGKISRNDSKPEETSNNDGNNAGNATSNSKNTTTTSSNEAKQRQSQEENTTQKQQTNDDTTVTSLSSSQNIPTPTLYHHPHHPHHYYPIRQMHPLIQPPFATFPLNETPELQIPEHTTVIISEESHEASTSVDLYRGTVGDMERDAEIIEQKAPTWLIEFLIKNKIPAKEPIKISFILKPHEGSELDELPNGNARLTANRMLRARKILAYIVEKLELDQPPINDGNPETESTATNEYLEKALNDSTEANNNDQEADNTGQSATKAEEKNNAMKPELWLELICQDQVLSPTMTLATIKSHMWKFSGDLTMTYRLRMKSV
ncbi:hypothetical protein RclHR1_08610007 [Rhizophagus clarus]|uniref:Uncharacterized protein n=1 Tax=Rhizophagus clarus TaxID=94130 RepID=A0A2Z6SFP8_9GLOM|nr:hypothetical protein RclHR1_08610007 [Rhizophagus clarus]